MDKIVLFLSTYIRPQEEPRQWLPIVGFVIAMCLLTPSRRFLLKNKFHQLRPETPEQLYRQLKSANLKIVFLCIFLAILSGFSLMALNFLQANV